MAQFRQVKTDDPVLTQVQQNISSVVDELSKLQGLAVVSPVTGTYRVSGAEDVIVADPSNGPVTVLLLDPAAKAKILTIKRTSSTSQHKVLVRCGKDSATIDGAKVLELTQAYQRVTVVSDSRSYLVLSGTA